MYRTALTKGVIRRKTIEPLPRFVQPIPIAFCCLAVVGIPYSVYAIPIICIYFLGIILRSPSPLENRQKLINILNIYMHNI